MLQEFAKERLPLSLWAEDAAPWFPAAMRVVHALGWVCRELRLGVCQQRGLPEHDYQSVTSLMPYGAGRSWKTLKGFEEGTTNPTRLDDVVLGYARASGVPVGEIWQRAIERAAAEDDPPGEFGQAVDAVPPRPPARPSGSARKRRTTRSRRARG